LSLFPVSTRCASFWAAFSGRSPVQALVEGRFGRIDVMPQGDARGMAQCKIKRPFVLVTVNPLLDCFSRQLLLRLGNRFLALHSLGLDRVHPRTFHRQGTSHDAYPPPASPADCSPGSMSAHADWVPGSVVPS